ncbi:SAM-dependent methyltransferase [Pseudanabaena sp. FACHB-2040]|uniref:SAM-dependent methyltransferase n=1 Tax=Pseudanabaena sp. FACHB-2040 TaxID=2692859 RepID=UPI001683AC37|nr:SAM-dependent methyltransferase [Pseudanabaena sp. FACHB-2040]MBD2256194.1 SAM-dependent methyltransferase [Pseudanabaena sp. FACHB-2040]
MKEVMLASTDTIEVPSPNTVFFCPEESQFYAQCLEKMVLPQCASGESVVEFGAGDGSPVISALLKSSFKGLIQGYELNAAACKLALSRIQQYRLDEQYWVHNRCFFTNSPSEAQYLIANPPYLPAPDNELYMPSLHGGDDGATITKQLLTKGCENVMLMISAYSNPIDTVDHALKFGYQVVDFMVSPLKFGYYSCEPKVKNTISELQRKRKAFFSENIYFLAGVLFQKKNATNSDLSTELLKVMTVL